MGKGVDGDPTARDGGQVARATLITLAGDRRQRLPNGIIGRKRRAMIGDAARKETGARMAPYA